MTNYLSEHVYRDSAFGGRKCYITDGEKAGLVVWNYVLDALTKLAPVAVDISLVIGRIIGVHVHGNYVSAIEQGINCPLTRASSAVDP